MALETLYKGGRGKGKQTGRREVTSQKEIKTCFRLWITIGSEFDVFVIVITTFKMMSVCKEEKRKGWGRESEYKYVGRVIDEMI